MSITPLYTDSGKWYKTPHGMFVSAGRVVSALTGETFDHIPLDTLKRAEMEGTGAHRIGCDLALKVMGHLEQVDMPPMPPDYHGDREKWEWAMFELHKSLLKFFDECEVEPIAVEQPDVSVALGVAGQPDIKAWVKVVGARMVVKRVMAVLDYKRVAAISNGHHLKLQLYRMLDGFKDCKASYIVWLKKDGGYKLIEVKNNPSDQAALIGMANVLRWQKMNGILATPH